MFGNNLQVFKNSLQIETLGKVDSGVVIIFPKTNQIRVLDRGKFRLTHGAKIVIHIGHWDIQNYVRAARNLLKNMKNPKSRYFLCKLFKSRVKYFERTFNGECS